MQTVLIRADSSDNMGSGHIMRTLGLARQLEMRGYRILYLCKSLPGGLNQKILASGYELLEFDAASKEDEIIDSAIQSYDPGLLVLDHYDIDAELEAYLINRHQLRLMVYDDLYNRHQCEILVNPNVHACRAAYEGKVPAYTKVLAGPQYAVLRDEFYEKRKELNKVRDKPARLLVTMGGSDPANVTCRLLRYLRKYSESLALVVVAGPSNRYYEEIGSLCNTFEQCTLLHKTDNMAECMQWADFAVTAAGQTTIETIFMRLPSVSIMVAENQRYISQYLKDNNLAICLDSEFTEDEINQSIEAMMTMRAPSMDSIMDLAGRIGTDSVAEEVHSLLTG